MVALVEYKVKQQGTAWERIPVAVTVGLRSRRYETQCKQADMIGLAISRGNYGQEVRWNFKDGYQGHYVRANITIGAYMRQSKEG